MSEIDSSETTTAKAGRERAATRAGLPTLFFPTLSLAWGTHARLLLLLALAVAGLPVASIGARTLSASAANSHVMPAASGSYTVIDLGTLGGSTPGSGRSTAYAINNKNQVVGDWYDHIGMSHSFLWTPTGPLAGTMEDLARGDNSHVYGINDAGHIVGQDGDGKAYIYAPPVNGGAGPSLINTFVSGAAHGINNKDQVVGTMPVNVDGTSTGHAFVWTPDHGELTSIGTITDLGDNGCLGHDSDGRAINDDTHVVGTSCTLPVDWSPHTPMTFMGDLGGHPNRAFALNNAGLAGGYSAIYSPDSGNSQVDAMLWDDSTPGPNPGHMRDHTDLGTLPGGDFATIMGINNDGVAVGYSTVNGTGVTHAAISRLGVTLIDLNSSIPSNSDWTLNHAYAINNNGVIVGDGRNGKNSGPMHAFLLLPSGQSLIPVGPTPTDVPTATDTPAPAPVGAIAITEVKAKYSLSYSYIKDVPLSNMIHVSVNWGHYTPGYIDYSLNGQHHYVPATAEGATFSINMGDLEGGPNELRIVAHDADGRVASQPRDSTACGLVLPDWLRFFIGSDDLGLWRFLGRGYSFSFKKQLFKIEAPPLYRRGSKIASRLFTDSKTEGSYKGTVSLLLSNPPVLKISFDVAAEDKSKLDPFGLGGEKPDPNVKIGPIRSLFLNVEVSGKIGLKGQLEFTIKKCNTIAATKLFVFGAFFEVKGTKKVPVVLAIADMFGGPAALIGFAIPPLYSDIFGSFYLELGASASLDAQPYFEGFNQPNVVPGLYFKDLSGTLGGSLEGGLLVPKGGAEFKWFVKGALAWAFKTPSGVLTNLKWDKTTVAVTAGYKFKAPDGGEFVREIPLLIYENKPTSTVGPNVRFHARVGAQPAHWSYVPHNTSPNYAVFRARSDVGQAFARAQSTASGAGRRAAGAGERAVGTRAMATISSTLESNVYTYTVPSLAVDPTTGKSLLLWVHDDPHKPAGASTEINFSRYDGSGWSAPTGITDDSLPDDAPQVTWTAGGNAVAVWTRQTQPTPITPTVDITTENGIQIATSSYSDTTGTWAPLSLLTTNPALHTSPQLTRNAGGQVLAVWRENPSGQLFGDADHPDHVSAAFYNNGMWSEPSVAIGDISGLVDLAAGYGRYGIGCQGQNRAVLLSS